MKLLNRCPSSLTPGYEKYSPKAARVLFGGVKVDHVLDFDFEKFEIRGDLISAFNRISVSGVQEKFPGVVIDGKIRLAGDSVRSTHILKPAPWDKTLVDRKQIPANEHITMQIASQVYGIETACNGLCFTPQGSPVYITRRFDVVEGGEKLCLEDFASVVEADATADSSAFKYQGSYRDIANGIRRAVPFWMVDMEKFFNLIVFNYIYGNGDAHLKNFSLLLDKGNWRLAPAYDLMNTALHVDGDDFALSQGLGPEHDMSDEYIRTGHPCRLDFERFGLAVGLRPNRIKRILDRYSELPPMAMDLIDASFMNEKFKRSYKRIIKERTSRFNRISVD